MASSVMTNLDPFVARLVKALGLPERTKSFELRCGVNEVVSVKCEYYPEANTAAGFDAQPLLAEYRLIRVGKQVEPKVPTARGTVLAGAVVCAVPALVLLCAWLGGR